MPKDIPRLVHNFHQFIYALQRYISILRNHEKDQIDLKDLENSLKGFVL